MCSIIPLSLSLSPCLSLSLPLPPSLSLSLTGERERERESERESCWFGVPGSFTFRGDLAVFFNLEAEQFQYEPIVLDEQAFPDGS